MLLPEPIIANWLMPALTYGVVHSIQILDGVQDDQRKRAGGAGFGIRGCRASRPPRPREGAEIWLAARHIAGRSQAE
jgi:hypothetical protein